MEDLTEAMAIDPTKTEAYIIRGEIYRAQGAFANALKVLKTN
jgi:Tfp pilus assembly protein PilF